MPRPKSYDDKDSMIISFRGFSRSLHKRLKQWALAHDRTLEYTFNHVVREWLEQQESREKSQRK
jgi:hypothetical protein